MLVEIHRHYVTFDNARAAFYDVTDVAKIVSRELTYDVTAKKTASDNMRDAKAALTETNTLVKRVVESVTVLRSAVSQIVDSNFANLFDAGALERVKSTQRQAETDMDEGKTVAGRMMARLQNMHERGNAADAAAAKLVAAATADATAAEATADAEVANADGGGGGGADDDDADADDGDASDKDADATEPPGADDTAAAAADTSGDILKLWPSLIAAADISGDVIDISSDAINSVYDKLYNVDADKSFTRNFNFASTVWNFQRIRNVFNGGNSALRFNQSIASPHDNRQSWAMIPLAKFKHAVHDHMAKNSDGEIGVKKFKEDLAEGSAAEPEFIAFPNAPTTYYKIKPGLLKIFFAYLRRLILSKPGDDNSTPWSQAHIYFLVANLIYLKGQAAATTTTTTTTSVADGTSSSAPESLARFEPSGARPRVLIVGVETAPMAAQVFVDLCTRLRRALNAYMTTPEGDFSMPAQLGKIDALACEIRAAVARGLASVAAQNEWHETIRFMRTIRSSALPEALDFAVAR